MQYPKDAINNAPMVLTDTVGRIITFSYEEGRLTRLTDPIGRVVQYSYDPVGNLISHTEPGGNVTHYRYDDKHRIIQIIDQRGNTLVVNSYDMADRVISQINGRGFETSFAYGTPQMGDTSITDPLGNTTIHTHDDQLRLLKVTDPLDNKVTFIYDEDNNLISITDQNGNTSQFAYDNQGNVISTTDPLGKIISYTYDALEQLTQVTHPDGGIVSYDYDAAGNQTSLTYPDGRTANYEYDALNRLIRVMDWSGRETGYTYDAANNLLQTAYPNDTTTGYLYDAANRLVRIKHQQNKDILAQFRYTLDEIGNRTGVEESGLVVPNRTLSYAYDALSQLTVEEEHRAGETTKRTEYTYDPAGNRLTMNELLKGQDGDGDTKTTNYIYDAADRLLQAGETTFTYDANGNRLTEATPGDHSIEYAYDAANLLTRVMQNGRAVTYAYDGDGNKVEQTVSNEVAGPSSTETFRFLNDLATPFPVVLEQDHVKRDKQETTHYLYGLARISEESPRSEPFFYHSDGLGSTRAFTDLSGTIRAVYQYDVWGNLETSTGPVPNRFLFTGEEQDPETGLYYLRARWYDPQVGRFLTVDPVGAIGAVPPTGRLAVLPIPPFGVGMTPPSDGVALLPPSISVNEYAYALNNPINFIDPSGEFSFKRAWKGIKKAATSPAGRFVIKLAVHVAVEAGVTAAFTAVSAAPALGIALPLVAGFIGGATSELAGSALRGEFGRVPLGQILARDIGLGGTFGAVGGLAPIFSNPIPGLYSSPFERWTTVALSRSFAGVGLGISEPKIPSAAEVRRSRLISRPTIPFNISMPLGAK